MPTETRTFKMDKQLLVDVIKRQAGSLWKAIIEGVMNAVDAGASKCEIELTRSLLRIKDNGKGFRSRADIENFFEVFGKPHEEREQKTFGRFRMGRGQLFAFGVNSWRSGEFEMVIDVEENGLDYRLREGKEHHDGCEITVELYNQLTNQQFLQMQEEIKANAKFVEIDVTLNNKTFTQDRSKVPWDIEIPEADIRIKNNQDLRVYNQGIRVLSYYRHRFGAGGDIVTKQPVQVNFARNDVMDNCPVWAKIVAAINKHVNARMASTRSERRRTRRGTPSGRPSNRLTEEDRRRIIAQAKDGVIQARAFKNAHLFTRATSRRNITVRQVHNVAGGKVTMRPSGSAWTYGLGTQLEINKMACVLDRALLARFAVKDGKALVDTVNAVVGSYDRWRLQWVPFATLEQALASECQPIADEALNRVETVVLATIRQNLRYLLRGFPYHTVDGKQRLAAAVNRRIVIGRGPRRSWTDGHTIVGLNRRWIRSLKADAGAWAQYAHLIIHELLHDSPTDQDHVHPAIFYERYHEWHVRAGGIGTFVHNCIISLPNIAASVRRRMTTAEARAVDRHEEAARVAFETFGASEDPDEAEASFRAGSVEPGAAEAAEGDLPMEAAGGSG